ncbi:Kv channel-interacting protein 4-like isoform X2 [Diorhabda carinulata]|uniref:Kv channel-interacting protein 4-like isoform X2 n=1 Tax=Diorhabda carinulata TaxID=1163345 RepID=UPI0025A1ABB3|nr:Kv channel-interacting protein 4-like isoform X2 [Diorhabda carinulata]
MSWKRLFEIRTNMQQDEEIEMANLENSPTLTTQKHSILPIDCFQFFKKTWSKFTETKELHPDDLDSLDLYYLNSELEDLETPPRYRPDSLEALCRATRFSEAEIKRIYRGFKAECPTGVVKEDTFKMIYAQFFPQGVNSSQYAHYVFNTLDQDHSGLISFEDFVQNLSILSRGSLDEKLRWAFSLYDINGDGCITREEMTDIVSAIYDLMGKLAEPCIEEDTVKDKVDRIFQKMDTNGDGVVTLDEFLECCRRDESISSSMAVFDTSI